MKDSTIIKALKISLAIIFGNLLGMVAALAALTTALENMGGAY